MTWQILFSLQRVQPFSTQPFSAMPSDTDQKLGYVIPDEIPFSSPPSLAPASPQDPSHLSLSQALDNNTYSPAPKPVPVGSDHASYKQLLQGYKTYQIRLRQVTDEHERLK